MKKIIYTRPDGGMSVVHPVLSAQFPGETDEAFLTRIVAKDVPSDATDTQIVENDVIPSDRTFRNAWEFIKDQVAVNMPKARDIQRDRLRNLRAPILKALDIAYQRADESKDEKAKAIIAEKKQALRDVTDDPALDDAQTPEELKDVVPEILKG